MKKVMIVMLMLVAFALGLSTTAEEKLYTKLTVITSVNTEEDYVVGTDFNGNDWVFEGCADWAEGDYCIMVMNTCGTTDITDDVIVTTTYGGWLDGSWGWDGQQSILSY